MLHKTVLPESFDFGMPSVELIGAYSGGLHKEAMEKRATAFEDVIADLKPKKGYEYLHVITTGAFEKYGANRNGDAWNGAEMDHEAPEPESGAPKVVHLDGGLSKYHDDTYMKNGAVYQEHKTKRNGVDPSGFIVAARYNKDMQRGELIIAVDANKWAPRLQRKAKGQDIYLSIGCDVPRDLCFPAGTLVMTTKGYAPIETVDAGEIVLTSAGNWSPVVTKFERRASDFVRIATMGFPLELECTQNHPLMATRAEALRSCRGTFNGGQIPRHTPDADGLCKRCHKQVDLRRDWIPAGDLKKNDYLVVKIDENAAEATVGSAFAYLCGMYLGDGSALRGKQGNTTGVDIYSIEGLSISASAAEKDACIVSAISKTYEAVTGKHISSTPDSRGKNALCINLYDKLLATRVLDLCGCYSKYKYIAKEIYAWSREEKAALLAGLIDSDGHVDAERNVCRVVTINRGLALAAQRLCWSLGIPATVCVGNTEKSLSSSSFASHSTAYALAIRNAPEDLIRFSAKLQRAQLQQHKLNGPTILLHNGLAYIRIIGVRAFTGEARMVYNLEVAGDHSYNAEGVDAHNCSICHNVAHTMDEHCDHFKKQRLQVFDTGDVSCVFNDSPSFYDISGVDVPADKIAFVLSKVASGAMTTKQASLEAMSAYGVRRPMLLTKAALMLDKLSNMEKEITCVAPSDDEVFAEHEGDNEKKKDFLLKVERYPSDEVISTCNRHGVLLTPDMFFALLGKEDPTGGILDIAGDCGFSCDRLFEDAAEDDDFRDELLDGAFDQVLPQDLGLDSIVSDFEDDFGMTRPAVNARIIRITIHGKPRIEREPACIILQKAAAAREVTEALKNTYTRYVLGFAAQNSDDTCRLALHKLAKLK